VLGRVEENGPVVNPGKAPKVALIRIGKTIKPNHHIGPEISRRQREGRPTTGDIFGGHLVKRSVRNKFDE
jgi:hypothetical protein